MAHAGHGDRQGAGPKIPAFYTRGDIFRLTTLSGWTIDRMVAQRRFPAPVEFSERRKLWIADQVDAWIAEKLAKASGTLPAPSDAERQAA